MSPDDLVRLKHMIDAASSALRFTNGRTREDLDADQLLAFGLTRAVMIIGEAAARITPAGRAALPEVPWNQIVGMRNRLVHAYFDVDLTILWETVAEALPDLLAKLQAWRSQGGGS